MTHPIPFPENTPLTPATYCDHLLKHTSVDGTLFLEYWFTGDMDDWLDSSDNLCLRCKVHWNEQACQWLTNELELLCDALGRIAPYLEELTDVSVVRAESILGSHPLAVVWSTYLNYNDDEPVEGFCSRELIITAQHYCRLLFVGAPRLIVENKMTQLAEVLLLFHFGDEVKPAPRLN